MSEDIGLLETPEKGEPVDVEPCILPLVVLFSIAAQQNRPAGAGGRPLRQGFGGAPGVARTGPGMARRRMVGRPVPDLRINRRWMY